MSDIVEKLGVMKYLRVPIVTEFANQAAGEIEGLRWRLKIRENIIRRLVAENQRLRLTDEEREAIEWYASFPDGIHADTLRKLLARLS